MIFNLNWIPEFYFFENKVRNPFNLDKVIDLIEQKIKEKEIFESNETIFWTILLFYQLDKLDLIDIKSIKEFILNLKYEDGGFKHSVDHEEPDICNTFYCVAILKLLEIDDIIEDNDIQFIINSQHSGSGGDGGFIHCSSKNCYENCNGKTSIKSSFFALSSLVLLNKLDKINKELSIKYFKSKTSDELDLIYTILSLKLLNENKINNLEDKILKISIWQIPESGISKKFPTITYTLWTIICLGYLEKIEFIDFNGMFDFLKSMQQGDGSFTEQYTSISLEEPSILSTVLGGICILYIWDKLISRIEDEILFKTQELSDVYFSPISIKFSVSSDLIRNISEWMISKEWLSGKIYNNRIKFRNFFDDQNTTTQEIITKIIKYIKSNPKQERIDLNEFSKQFNFSNVLERVKLVINDLIIHEFLVGEIKSYRKKFFLEDFLILEEFIHPPEPVPYEEVINGKKKLKKAKYDFLTLKTYLTNFLEDNSEEIQLLINEEDVVKAKEKLNHSLEDIKAKIQQFENLVNQIKSEIKLVNSQLFIKKCEEKWPNIKASYQELLNSVKSDLEEKIKDKEETLIERAKTAEDKKAINVLDEFLKEIISKTENYLTELQEFFLKNHMNHNIILDSIEDISSHIEHLNSEINSKISKTTPLIHFDKFKKDIEKINNSWNKKFEGSIEILKNYKKIIENRSKLQEFIKERASELQKFSNENKKKINVLLEKNKLQESSNLLNKSINNFNKKISQQYEDFNEIVNKINTEIQEFPDFSNDIIIEWNKTLTNEENEWNDIVTKLKTNLHLKSELARKDELSLKLTEGIKILKSLLKDIKNSISDLINNKKLNDADNKINEMYTEINQKIKINDQEFNNFIKSSLTEFESFSETVEDLIQNWDNERESIIQDLNRIKEELENNLREARNAEIKKAMKQKREELTQKLKENSSEIENIMDNMKKNILDLIETKKIAEAENKTNELYKENSQKIKTIDQEIRKFIKTTALEFKEFRETVEDLIINWDENQEKFKQNLDKIKKELEITLDKAYSENKKEEIYERIETELSNFENKVNQLGLKYNLILKSRKNLDENEAKFETEYSEISDSLKTFDLDIRNSIRYASKVYIAFNKMREEIDNFWDVTKLGAEKKLESVYTTISDDFFIKNVQVIVSAFKGKRIELNYLSNVMKRKPKPLKLKLIKLISNSKLDGLLDSSSDTFILTDGVVHEGVPLKDIELTEEELEKDEDEIIRKEILKVRYLMVIHYRVGASVYSRKLGHWKMDSDMIGGFLTAMQDFSAEIKKKNIPMKRMEYKEFEILIEQGRYIFAALFVDGKESDWLRKKLQSYVKKFEKYFESSLRQWRGELRTFSNSGFLVDEVFELYRV